MLLLTDESVGSVEYKESGGSKLYMFPYSESDDPNMKVTLSVLKQGETYALLDSTMPKWGECVSFDSYFKVMRANKAILEQDEDDLNKSHDSSECEVTDACKDQQYVNVVICTSDKRNKSTMFAIIKERDENKFIKGMSLIFKE